MMFIWTLILSVSMVSSASTFIGNGGEGVLKNGRILLLDFLENGISLQEKNCGDQIDPRLGRLSFNATLSLTPEDQRCLTWAFQRVGAVSEALRESLYVSANLYRWILVDGKLKDSPVALTYQDQIGKLKTIANRHLDGIRISREGWKMMSSVGHSGLILHELIYSMLKLNCKHQDKKSVCIQDPLLVRNLVGQVYTPRLKLSSKKSQWFSSFFGDELEEKLKKNSLSPTLISYQRPDNHLQYAIFLRRRCNLIGSKTCWQKSKEPLVRFLYKTVLKRSATDFEIFWWVDSSSRVQYQCSSLSPVFFQSPENLVLTSAHPKKLLDADEVCQKYTQQFAQN